MTNVQSQLLNMEGIPRNMFGVSFDINKLKSIAGHGKQFSAHCLKDSGNAVLQPVSVM
jgi:hypothetical protein